MNVLLADIDFRGAGGKAGRLLRIFLERNAAGRQSLREQAETLPQVNADSGLDVHGCAEGQHVCESGDLGVVDADAAVGDAPAEHGWVVVAVDAGLGVATIERSERLGVARQPVRVGAVDGVGVGGFDENPDVVAADGRGRARRAVGDRAGVDRCALVEKGDAVCAQLDADADEFIAFAVDGATRMQHLIQDLLSFSRVTTKGKELQVTDSGATCEQAIANLRAAIAESGAVVTIGSLPTVRADTTQLTQLLQNLIGNAIKYSNERKPEVRVAATAIEDRWVFSVQDNGIGIEPQYFERIFQMFQRLHTRKQYTGTGVGLAICRKIVERHGGRIWVESQPGEGSTFLFTIPRAERSST